MFRVAMIKREVTPDVIITTGKTVIIHAFSHREAECIASRAFPEFTQFLAYHV